MNDTIEQDFWQWWDLEQESEVSPLEIWQAANARYAPRWISVEDARPENPQDGDKILGWNGYAFECEYDDGIWCSIGGEEFTRWMPLTPQLGDKE